MLHTGLVGAGMWGRTHALAYHTHPGARLMAVCDVDEARARALAAEFGIPRVYASAEDLAADPDIHAVSVATPDFAHVAPALAVIRERKPLLVEKPLATTVEDALAIAGAAEAAGILAMVDFHNRFNVQFDTAKKRIGDGPIGAVRHLYVRHNVTRAFPLDMLRWRDRSSALWFIGSHSADLARWLVGDEVAEVYAVSTRGILDAEGADTTDTWASTLRFRGGAVAVLENSWALPRNVPGWGDFRTEIIGEHGVNYTHLQAPEVNELYTEREHQRNDFLLQLDIQGRQFGFTLQSIQYFADCVIADRVPFISLRDGVQNTRILCALEESARAGRPVSLAGDPGDASGARS
ncbi:MAG: Gfo/Idh/MocA family protein [Chloroflexota bacterium]